MPWTLATPDPAFLWATRGHGCLAAKASITLAEKIIVAPALTVMATPRASVISSLVAPFLIAASVWYVMQPSHCLVTATANAINSRVLASSFPVFAPASLISR